MGGCLPRLCWPSWAAPQRSMLRAASHRGSLPRAASTVVHQAEAAFNDDPTVAPSPVPVRFALSDPAWLQHLSDYGYVVLKDVLDASELATAHDLLWDFLPGATGWQRGAPETWRVQGLRRCGLPQVGILKASGAGNCDAIWFCRTRPKVQEAFAQIWGTSELISSMDGFNVFLPWHHGRLENRTQEGWLHADQGPGKQGLHAVQGFVALTNQGTSNGGLQILPGSHHVHSSWVTTQHFEADHDFCMIRAAAEDPPLSTKLLQQERHIVECSAGDLVLWDSRTVHANAPGKEPDTAPDELLRVAMYTCLVPRSLATPEQLQFRRHAYNHGFSCNHWPVFSPHEATYFDNAGSFRVTPLDRCQDGRHLLI